MSKNISLKDAANSILGFMKEIESYLPDPSEDQLSLLCVQINHAVLVRGEEGSGKSALLSTLKDEAQHSGWNIIRITCREGFNSPLGLARSLISQAERMHPRKAAALRDKYQDALSVFYYKKLPRLEQSDAVRPIVASLNNTRVNQQISNEATIGLSVYIVDYLLQLMLPVNKLVLILVDDIQFADTWSVSFLAYLIRRIQRFSIAICITSDSRAKEDHSTTKFLSEKNRLLKLTLETFNPTVTDGETKVAEHVERPLGFREVIERTFKCLSATQQLTLSSLYIFGQPIGIKELETLSEPDQFSPKLDETLVELQSIGAIHKHGKGHQARYSISNSIWKSTISASISSDRREHLHQVVADILQTSFVKTRRWRPALDNQLDTIYFHLLRSGDIARAFAYQKVYYSCPVNTYLEHVTDNSKRLNQALKINTAFNINLNEHLTYQIASDTIRRVGNVKEKILDCKRYLRIGRNAYLRSEIYGNLCVLYANLKTELAYRASLRYSDKAYREARRVSDPDQRKHITAILNNATALIHFRQKDAHAAIVIEEEALRLIHEAKPLTNTVMVSKEAILNSLAQIYSRLLKDYVTANNIHLTLKEEARAHQRVEKEVEHSINLGKNLYYARQHEEAVHYFLEAIRLSKDNYRLVTGRMYAYKAAGLCYQFLGRHALAVEAFKDCLDLAVNSTDPSEISNLLGSIGLSFYKQRQYKQAVCSYSQALGVSMSTNLKRQMSKHWGHLGVVYTEMNEYQRAAECFFSAARLCLSMRDLENAIQYYTATMSCYTMCHIPCHGRVLKQIKKATQFKTAMNNVALSNNFAKAYLDQTDILLQSSRNNDAKDMLRYFDGLAKELNLTLTSSQRFETLRQEATAGQG